MGSHFGAGFTGGRVFDPWPCREPLGAPWERAHEVAVRSLAASEARIAGEEPTEASEAGRVHRCPFWLIGLKSRFGFGLPGG